MLHILENTEEVWRAWGKLLSDALDSHASVKRINSKRKNVPFMTTVRLNSIRHNKKLRQQYPQSKNPADPEKYRSQRDVTSSLRRKAISNFLRFSADGAKGIQNNFGK